MIRALSSHKLHRIAVVDVEDGNRVCERVCVCVCVVCVGMDFVDHVCVCVVCVCVCVCVQVLGIVTQSAVVRFLLEHRDLFGPLAALPMSHFVRADKPIVCIVRTLTVREAMRVLLGSRITGAPIVDADGVIIANISTSDIRCLAKLKDDRFDHALALPVLDFLREMRSATRSMSPLVLHSEDSLSAAVELLTTAAVHRVYIVDSGRRPVGVVALADVLAVVAPPHTHAPPSDAASSSVPAPTE